MRILLFRRLWFLLLAIAVSASAMKKEAVEVCVVQVLTPRYPPIARQARIEGEVQMEVLLTPNGSVREIKPINGHPLLQQAADESIRQWKFKCSSWKCPENLKVPLVVVFRLRSETKHSDCPHITVSQPPIKLEITSHRSIVNTDAAPTSGLGK